MFLTLTTHCIRTEFNRFCADTFDLEAVWGIWVGSSRLHSTQCIRSTNHLYSAARLVMNTIRVICTSFEGYEARHYGGWASRPSGPPFCRGSRTRTILTIWPVQNLEVLMSVPRVHGSKKNNHLMCFCSIHAVNWTMSVMIYHFKGKTQGSWTICYTVV